MKITKRQLRKLILKEFRDLGKNFNDNTTSGMPPLPPVNDEEGGGEGKDWSAELIKRLHKIGYRTMGRSSTAAKVLNGGESMLYIEDVMQNSGVVMHLHARNHVSNANQTDEERVQRGPTMIASTKFETCDNGMDVNKIIRKVLILTKKISKMTGDMIYSDLEKLRPHADNKENEEFDFFTILNNNEFLIDYYAR